MFDLSDKKALVTGASGSLGKEIAIALAEAGADVACHCFKNREAAEELRKRIENLGRKSIVVQADLTDASEAERVVRETVEGLGDLHILVNNAGVNRQSLFLRQKPGMAEDVLINNLATQIHVAQSAARVMAKNKWGRLIHMGSVVAHMGSIAEVSYASSKAGVEGMSRGIARELGGRNVTSNVVAPGFISAGMAHEMSDERREYFMKLIALGRTGEPRDVAAAVVFLACEEANYITGAVLHVNGGMYMQ